MFSQSRTSKFINVLSYIFIALNLLVVPIFLDKNLNNSYIIPKQYVFGGLVLINALLWMTRFVLTKKFQFTKTMLDKPIMITLFAALVSAAFSVDIYDSFFGRADYFVFNFVLLALLAAFYYVIVNFVKTEKLWRVVYDLLVFSGFASMLHFVLKNVFHLNFLNGIFGNAWNTVDMINSVFGVWVVAIFVLTFGLVLKKENNPIRLVAYILTGLLSFWVLLLLSFKVLWWLLLVSMVLLLMYGVSLVRQVRTGWLSVLFFFLTLSIVFIFFGTPKLVQLNVPTEVALGAKPSAAVTWSTLTSGVKTFVIGSGLGSFGVDFSQFRNPVFNSDSVAWSLRFNQPFNTFLAIVSEGGILLILALVFLVLIVVGHVFSIWNKIRVAALNHETPDFSGSSVLFESFLVTIAFAVLTIGSFMVFYSQVLWWAWWLLLALAVSGFSFYYRTFLQESELILEDTPQYSLSFSFGLIVAMTALVMVSVFGARLYLAEMNFAKAMQSKNYKQAEMFLAQSIENRPNSDTYHAALAQVYLNEAVDLSKNTNPDVSAISGLVAKAVNEAKAATDLSPKSVALWENLATMYENASAIVPEARDWAFKTLSQARDLEPTNPTLWWRLGNSYAATAKWEDAIKHYQKSIELKPDYFSAYVGLSNAYEQTQKLDLAVGVFEKLISQNKVNAEIMYNYGRLLYNRNTGADRDNALKIWLKVVEQQPNYSNALYSIGLWYENKNDLTNAFKYYYKVRDLNPSNRNILEKINKLLGTGAPAVQTTTNNTPSKKK